MKKKLLKNYGQSHMIAQNWFWVYDNSKKDFRETIVLYRFRFLHFSQYVCTKMLL